MALSLLMLTCLQVNADVVKIVSGIVTDQRDGSPIPGVVIRTLTSKKVVSTDLKGKYKISISDEDQQLRFSAIGYQTFVAKIKGDQLNVSLEQSHSELAEIVVTREASSSSISAPLSGKVAGISTSKEMISGSDRSFGQTELQPNQLTAGEWNDINHWDFWTRLMRHQEFSGFQSHWGFDTRGKLSIQLKNRNDQALSNYRVTAFGEDKKLWTAQTNFEGKAVLWPFLYRQEAANITVVITDANGEEVYRKNTSSNHLTVTLNRKRERITDLDVMFMVDATGSMGDEISYLKAELEDIIGRLNRGNQLNTRTAMVFYRDHTDEYLIRDFGFNRNLDQVKNNLNKQHADGGGDFEEAVEKAMENAIFQQQWTKATAAAKIMFMILDAPPHHDSAKIKSLQKSVKAAAEKGIILIPVVASGIDKNTEFLMRFMAMATNGTYVFLTDDSGIGNSHLKPTIGHYQVEHLNNLLNRLIRKYSGLDNAD